jgi:hypothetical protein
MYQMVDDWVRDQPEGPGWSLLMDVNRCPPEALGWLGQFVGVRIPTGLTDAQQRQWIKDRRGFRRGTPAAMIAAVQDTLTGTKAVKMIERDGDPYNLTLTTTTSETPDANRTLAAILSQKPAGITLNKTSVVTGTQTWDALKGRDPNWNGTKTRYTTWTNALWNT